MARPKAIENRQALIIEAAAELFARYGYERTSMDDIARHLNIGKGSIYLDFRTKEDILMVLNERHAEKLLASMIEKMENCGAAPLSALREMFEECMISCYDTISRDIHTPEAMLHASFAMRKRFSHFFVQKRSLVLGLLKKAAAAHEIAPEKASDEMVMAIVMATASFFPPYLANYCESDERITREQLIKRSGLVLDFLISGLRASASPANEDCRPGKSK